MVNRCLVHFKLKMLTVVVFIISFMLVLLSEICWWQFENISKNICKAEQSYNMLTCLKTLKLFSGKTLLAKAVATECNTTFFNISASSIVSKWRGDSEKLVRVLFELARYHAPSTIFVDELESLMSQRGSTGGNEHEGSLRMKTELLVQMDGLAKSDDLVFLLAASNLPWELDHAMLRRLEKRILVDLPTAEARKQMFKHHLPPLISQEGGVSIECNLNYDRLADITEGYTGSDIQLVCKEAAMRRVRSIFSVLEEMESNPETPNRPNKLKIDPVTTADVEAALQSTKPSASNLQPKYNAWRKQYESA